MNYKVKLFFYTMVMFIFTYAFSIYTYAARSDNEIEAYKIGNTSITIKWTPYDSGGLPIDKYSIGYRVYGAPAYTTIDVLPNSLDFDALNNEFKKTIGGLTSGTIYDVKIDTYVNGNLVPVNYYSSIKVMTKIIIDKSVSTISNPFGDDTIGHLDFAFYAPDDNSGSVDVSNITGYNLIVSATEGQIYSNGQPYKVLYNVGTQYQLYKISGADTPLTYNNGSQNFVFNSQTQNGKELLAFALYKSNQPTADNFNLGKIYYVLVQPIFKAGTLYENVIVDATARYESIENISTILPLEALQVSNDLINLQFPSVGTGSMSYDIYRGRLPNTLSKIHTEYDDGTRTQIQYYNKIDDPVAGDVYYFKVMVSGQGISIKSKIIPVTISLNPNVAPIIENLKIESVVSDTVSDYADVIISWDKPKNEDSNIEDLIYRFYLNTDQINQVYENDVVHDGNGNLVLDSNGKIVLNTKKDINNNNILFKGYPVVYERVTEIFPENLTGSDDVYTGNDPLNYFLTTGKNYYRIIRDDQEVVRTIYRIRGQNFINNADVPKDGDGNDNIIYPSILDGDLSTNYKNKIELNTTYFMKMDTYNQAIDEESDYSLPVSFTTPSDIVDTIPTPSNFGVDIIDTQKIGLVWDKLNEDIYLAANVSYEVFVSENNSYADADFYRIKNPAVTLNNNEMHLVIDTNYTFDDDVPRQLQSNKAYLFRVCAKYDTKDLNGNNISIYSNLSEIIPVTTKRVSVSDPDVNAPPAPMDFTLIGITSKVADFNWTKVDNTSTYRIVRTSEPIGQFAPLSQTGNGVTSGFVPNGNKYSYSDAALAANTLYYFSIRSETVFNGNTLYSPWITIPVTTVLVEAPTELALVSRQADGHAVKIKFKGKASLSYESAKKDDSITTYQISETIPGDALDPSTKVFELTLQSLKSNTVYLIKVRAKDPISNAYSKYTEPIQIRTEFNQSDYDNDEEKKEKEELITDLGNDWLKKPMERIGADSGRFEIWVKTQLASDVVKNTPMSYLTVDLSKSGTALNKAVYLSTELVNSLNENSVSLEIKTKDGKVIVRPETLDSDTINSVYNNTMLNNTLIKSKALKIQINELSGSEMSYVVPNGSYAASKVSDISIRLIGYSKTETDLNTAIATRVNSIINAKKAALQGSTIEQIKENLDITIRTEVKNIIDYSYVSEAPVTLLKGKLRYVSSFTLDPSGKSNGYSVYIKNGNISEEIQGEMIDTEKLQFETATLGRMVVIGKNGSTDISDYAYEESIKQLIANYDFSKELINGRFKPEVYAKRQDIINFMVDILNPKGKEYESLDNLGKAQKLGIMDGIQIWSMDSFATKEELAFLASKIYQIKTGVDLSKIKINKNIYISDIDSINYKYRQNIYWILDNKVMRNDEGNIFYPSKKVTRGEAAQVLSEVLKMVGELK